MKYNQVNLVESADSYKKETLAYYWKEFNSN